MNRFQSTKLFRLLPILAIFVLTSVCAQATALLVGNFFGIGDVKKYNATTGASEGDFVPAGSGGLSFPLGAAIGPDGNLYVSDSNSESVLRYNGKTGAFIDAFVNGEADDAAAEIFRNGFLYVANSSDPGSVSRFNATTGASAGFFVTPGSGGLVDPEGMVFGPDGNLYVTSGGSVLRYSGTTGAFIDTFVTTNSGGLHNTRSIAFAANGDLLAADFFPGGGILRYNGTTGAFLNNFVAPGGLLAMPRPIAFGPDGNLYVGDFGNGSVVRYNGTTGALIDTFVSSGSGGLGGPTFLVFDPNTDGVGAVPDATSTFGLLGIGLAGLAYFARMRRAIEH